MVSYKSFARIWALMLTVGIIVFPLPLLVGKAAAPTIAELPIYKGTLTAGWINWSWGSTVDFASTTRVDVNGHSLAFTANSPWAGLYLHTEAAINTQPFTSIHLTVNASQPGAQYAVALYDSNNQFLKSPVSLSKYGGDPLQGAWKSYTIPLNDLESALGAVKGIMVQSAAGSPQAALYIDTLSFAADPPVVPVPTPGSSPIPTPVPIVAPQLPPVPAAWPFPAFQLGAADSPGNASSMKTAAPFGMRYQYLTGGVNTGNGWTNWDAGSSFASKYMQESFAQGIMPVFSYYQMRPSLPGATMGESDGDNANAQSAATMGAYFNDLKIFFQKAGAFGGNKVVLQVEPDFWGFMQQRGGDNAANQRVVVGSAGLVELAGIPDTMSGYAQAILKLRDTYARNVLVAYHLSVWGVGSDILYSKPSASIVTALASRSANYYKSLNANFDLAFTDQTDRDAGFKQYVYGDGGTSWFSPADYTRSAQFIGAFVAGTGKRVVIWQIPMGNTVMRAANNTWNHYQDNHVQWWLDDSTQLHLNEFKGAGVIGMLFGRGDNGATCACDANNDGITNPSPINGNTINSMNADDDGGFFHQKVQGFYAAGAPSLP
jgi:hypothetical protein